jgi:hypothetical protein
MKKHRIFILSPARTDGKRAALLTRKEATFELAQRLRARGIPLGEAFTFLSGLYFRGKTTYAAKFGQAPPGLLPQYVITSSHGLLAPHEVVDLQTLTQFSEVPIELTEPRYRQPLEKSIHELKGKISETCEVILLGSVATDKYCEPLLQAFGSRLLFPRDFIGRGDMSRGGLLLRAVRGQKELEYVSLQAVEKRTGQRPPKLPRLRS